jgi:cytosine deaminase
MEADGAPGAADGKRIELDGALVLPGLIDGHVHLDTTLFGDEWRPHKPCVAGFDVGERLAIQKEMNELLDEAMKNGAEIVGGLDPAGFEGDIDKHLDIVFGMAERHGTGIDLHLHDGGELGLYELEEIARRTKAQGLQGRVNVSHAYALGEEPWARVASTAARLAEAGVSIMTNAPGDHPFPPVLQLRETGVTVFAGNDDIRDSWWPYGDADMLERAMLVGYRSGFLTDEELGVAFDMVTGSAAQALGLEDYGLRPGAKADFVVLDAAHVPEAVVARPRRAAVYKSGRLVASEGPD